MTGAWASAAALWSSVRQRPSTRRETTRGPEPELDLSQELDTLTHFCLFVSNKRFTFHGQLLASKIDRISRIRTVDLQIVAVHFSSIQSYSTKICVVQ